MAASSAKKMNVNGADIAETGAPRQQVDIDAVFGGVIGNRDTGEEDQHANDRDGQRRI